MKIMAAMARNIKMKGVGLIVALVVLVIVFGPLASIWALNTLFPALAIPYTFQTWLAAVVLGGLASGGAKVKAN